MLSEGVHDTAQIHVTLLGGYEPPLVHVSLWFHQAMWDMLVEWDKPALPPRDSAYTTSGSSQQEHVRYDTMWHSAWHTAEATNTYPSLTTNLLLTNKHNSNLPFQLLDPSYECGDTHL